MNERLAALVSVLAACSGGGKREAHTSADASDAAVADTAIDAATEAHDIASDDNGEDAPSAASPCDARTCPEACCASTCCALLLPDPPNPLQPPLFCCKGRERPDAVSLCMTREAWDVNVCGELP